MFNWPNKTTVPQVPVGEVHAARSGEDAPPLIDVRTPAEYADAHALGAVNIPLNEVTARRDELARYDGEPVYIICRSGARSMKAAKALTSLGVQAVNVQGGTMAWIQAGYPTE